MKKMSSILVGALLIALWNSVLFYGKDLGISVLLFNIPLLFFIIYALKENNKINNKYGLLFMVPILLLSFTYFLFDNLFFNICNIIVITILFIMMYLYTIRPSFHLGEILGSVFSIVFEPIESISDVIGDIQDKVMKSIKMSSQVGRFIKSLVVVLPIVIIILYLLISADMVFENMFTSIFHLFENISFIDVFGNTVTRLFFIAILFIYLSATIYFLTRKFVDTKYDLESLDIKVNNYTIKLLLTLLNIIYIVFDIIQIRSLLLHRVSMDVSYAEYARAGFFQLMFVSVINLGILLFSKVYEEKDSKNIYEKIMSILMIGLTFIIICSSFMRMNMYESEYGYTMLRLLVYVALFTESMMLIPTIIYIINGKFNIFKSYMVICIVVYTVLNYVNVDYVIANRNIERFYETEKIDINYLKNDGADNILLLVDLYKKTDDVNVHNSLVDYFKRVEFLTEGFQEFNLAKERANKLIQELELEYMDEDKDSLFNGENKDFLYR